MTCQSVLNCTGTLRLAENPETYPVRWCSAFAACLQLPNKFGGVLYRAVAAAFDIHTCLTAFAPLLSVLKAAHEYIVQLGDDASWIMEGILLQLRQAAVYKQLPVLVDAFVQQLAAPMPPAAIRVMQLTAAREAGSILIPAGDYKLVTDLWQSTAWLLDALRQDVLTALQDKINSSTGHNATQREEHHVAALAAALAAAAMQHASRVLEQLPAAFEPPAELRDLVHAAGLSILDHTRHVVKTVVAASAACDGAASTAADMQHTVR